ncbi:hypothetical protein G9A89_002024 [Geosiphon pyriformis]|nr:hypothetical protein G9A89_002024 [Geosiphon pyriformis]
MFKNGAGSNKVADMTTAYFPAVDTDIEIRVAGLRSSTLTELQAIALALECVLFSCAVVLYLDSQFAINVYTSEASFTVLDFHN